MVAGFMGVSSSSGSWETLATSAAAAPRWIWREEVDPEKKARSTLTAWPAVIGRSGVAP